MGTEGVLLLPPQPVAPEDEPWDTRLQIRSDAIQAATERAATELASPSTMFIAAGGPGSPALVYGASRCNIHRTRMCASCGILRISADTLREGQWSVTAPVRRAGGFPPVWGARLL